MSKQCNECRAPEGYHHELCSGYREPASFHLTEEQRRVVRRLVEIGLFGRYYQDVIEEVFARGLRAAAVELRGMTSYTGESDDHGVLYGVVKKKEEGK